MKGTDAGIVSLGLMAILLLAACGTAPDPATSLPAPQASPPTRVATIIAVVPVTPTEEPCAFREATFSGSDPASPVGPLQAAVQAGLASAGVPAQAMRVDGVGENCVNSKGVVRRACCTATDVTLTLTVQDLKDRDARGTLLAQALTVIYGAAEYSSGNIAVTFVAPAGEEHLRFGGSTGRAALDQGLTGTALLDALAKP